MNTVSIRLPNSLHKQLREIAKSEGVSLNQLITSAVAEKLAVLMTVEYLQERARHGSRERFERVLAKVPDVEPENFDRMPAKSSQRTRHPRR